MKIIVYHHQMDKFLKNISRLLIAGILIVIAFSLQIKPQTAVSEPFPGPDRSLPIEELTTEPDKESPIRETVTVLSSSAPVTQTQCADDVILDEIPLSKELQRYTQSLCKTYQVPYALALAVIEHESGFDTDAMHQNTNGTVDSGLMQLNEIVAAQVEAEYAVTDLMDPKQNLHAGIGILADYLSRHSISDSVMAYINGESGMLRLKAAGISSTEATDEEMVLMDKYEALLGSFTKHQQLTEQIVQNND